MNKFFKRMTLVGAALLMGVVACTDYQSDINRIDGELAALGKKFDDLNTQISKGAVIESVTEFSDANGSGFEIKLSGTGGIYKVYNGKNGKDGSNGSTPDLLVEARSDGYWYVNGKKQDGATWKGQDGVGSQGAKGDKGDSIYWEVENREDGSVWFVQYKQEGDKAPAKTGKEQKIGDAKSGNLIATWNDNLGEITFTGVEGSTKPVTINTTSQLKSLVVIPQGYLAGVELINIYTLEYYPLSFKAAEVAANETAVAKDHTNANDISDEQAGYTATAKYINLTPTAEYYVNPANAKISEDAADYVAVLEKDQPYYTKGKSNGLSVSVAKVEKQARTNNGKKATILKVTYKISGTPASLDDRPAGDVAGYLSMIALEYKPSAGSAAAEKVYEGETVTSDYATLYKNRLDGLRIASKAAATVAGTFYNNHYRRAYVGIGNKDAEALKLACDGVENLKDRAANEFQPTFDEIKKSCDVQVAFDGTLDLMTIVVAHREDGSATHTPLTADELKALGLKWQFEVVKGYKNGNPATLQENFVTLSATTPVDPGQSVIFTPRAYGFSTTEAAIGRSPIIRVSLLDGNNIVECAYIKVYIGRDAELPPQGETIEREFETTFAFDCYKGQLKFQLTPQQMSDNFYVDAKLSKKEFHELADTKYTFDPNQPRPTGETGEVAEYNLGDTATGATIVLEWTVSMEDIWTAATSSANGGNIKRIVYYKRGERVYKITFKAKVDAFSTTWDIFQQGKGQYSPSFWFDDEGKIDNVNFGHTRFNVFTPKENETDSKYCLFESNLNVPFLTDENGKIIVKYSDNMPFSDFEYFFCKDNNNLSIAGIQLKVKATDPLTLYGVKGGTEEVVATIQNTVYQANDYLKTEIQNVIILNKASDFAKTMLNAGYDALKVYIGAKANICGVAVAGTAPAVTAKQITLYFNGKDHFEGRFLRPVTINTETADHFIDAVDKGEKGSWMLLADLINPMDWRLRKFGPKTDPYDPTTYDPDADPKDKVYPYYWYYYGIGNVTLIGDSIKSNYMHLESNTGVDNLPATAELYISDTKAGDVKKNFGTAAEYLIYHNNKGVTWGYKLFLKVSVDYVWGTVTSDEITVIVEKTPTADGGQS